MCSACLFTSLGPTFSLRLGPEAEASADVCLLTCTSNGAQLHTHCVQVSSGYSTQTGGSQAFRIRLTIPAQVESQARQLQEEDLKKPFAAPAAAPLQAPAPQAHLFPDMAIAATQQVRSS